MATPSDKYLGGELTPTQSAAVAALDPITPAQAEAVCSIVVDTISDSGSSVLGDVVRYDGAGVLAGSQADTVAHAAIDGVWSGSQMWGRGELATVNFYDLPVVGSQCYLSATARKAQMAAPVLGMVPRRLGKVVRVLNSTPGSYQAHVLLDFDAVRDDLVPWLMETWTASGSVADHAFSGLVSSGHYRITSRMLPNGGAEVTIFPDGQSAPCSWQQLLQTTSAATSRATGTGVRVGVMADGFLVCEVLPRAVDHSCFVSDLYLAVGATNPNTYRILGSTTRDFTSLTIHGSGNFPAGQVFRFWDLRNLP